MSTTLLMNSQIATGSAKFDRYLQEFYHECAILEMNIPLCKNDSKYKFKCTAMLNHFTDDNFDKEVMNSKGVVVVDFFADWCGPCVILSPIIEELAGEYGESVKMGKFDVDSGPQVTSKFDITSIPTVIIFKDGAMVEKVIGVQGKEDYKTLIAQYL